MENLRTTQESLPIPEPDWVKLYVLSKHWKSDLEFHKQNIIFLKRLIDNYFIWITKKENVDAVKAIKWELSKTLRECNDLLKEITVHTKHLASMVQGEAIEESHLLIPEHENLENEMATFVKACRKNRKETFKITEYVIDIEKLSHLLPT